MIERRRFLTSLLGGAAIARAQRQAPLLESIEVLHVRVNHRGNWLLVRMKAGGGVTGIGDASHGVDEQTLPLLEKYFSWLKGQTPFSVEPYRRALMKQAESDGRSGTVAFSALEQCLYDLQGKLLGIPCWALFGGQLQPWIRHYANINRATVDRSPEGFSKLAEPAVAAGFDAIKMASFDGLPKDGKRTAATQLGIDCAAAVRKTIGPQRALLLDGHSNFTLEEALDVTRRLEPLNLFWWEEATPGIANLAAVNKAAKMPTAGGESIFGLHNYYPYIAGGAVDIVMPDVKYCGGMLELKKISAMAEGAGLPSAPHGPASPVGNMAAAQVATTLPNFQILELGFGEVPWRAELIDPPEVFEKGGLLKVPDQPGLGITINEKLAKAFAVVA
jgi:galactonate dehydratase